jgi:putative addiction module component (TIGR02574 family)
MGSFLQRILNGSAATRTSVLRRQVLDVVKELLMRRAETLLHEALTLPDDERAEIAGALLESLEPAPELDVETAWRQEVAARVAAAEAGEVTTTPWEEIRERFMARLSERRQS